MHLIDNYIAYMTVSDTFELQELMDYLTANKKKLNIDNEVYLSDKDNYIQVPRSNGTQMLGIALVERYLAPEPGTARKYKALEISSEDMYHEDGYEYLIPCEDFSDLTDALLEKFETDIH